MFVFTWDYIGKVYNALHAENLAYIQHPESNEIIYTEITEGKIIVTKTFSRDSFSLSLTDTKLDLWFAIQKGDKTYAEMLVYYLISLFSWLRV